MLFNIPFPSAIREVDRENAERVVEFYLGGWEEVGPNSLAQLVQMFTDAGSQSQDMKYHIHSLVIFG